MISGGQMSERKILAFYSPYPGAGKTTARNCILFPQGVRRCSFADPVREIVSSLFSQLGVHYPGGFKDSHVPGVPGNSTLRDFLIAFGQAGRSVWPDIWAEILHRQIESAADEYVVIDDLRMPNEYIMLRSLGAKIVRLTVPGREIVPSETEGRLEGCVFDAELENSMDGLRTFYAKVWALVEGLWA